MIAHTFRFTLCALALLTTAAQAQTVIFSDNMDTISTNWSNTFSVGTPWTQDTSNATFSASGSNDRATLMTNTGLIDLNSQVYQEVRFDFTTTTAGTGTNDRFEIAFIDETTAANYNGRTKAISIFMGLSFICTLKMMTSSSFILNMTAPRLATMVPRSAMTTDKPILALSQAIMEPMITQSSLVIQELNCYVTTSR